MSPKDLATIAAACEDHRVRVIHTSPHDLRVTHTLQAHTGSCFAQVMRHCPITCIAASVWCVAFDRSGARLASSSDDTTVIVWDTADWHVLQVLRGHTESVCDVAFSVSGEMLASGSYDESAIVWDTATGKELARLKGHEGAVRGVAWLANHVVTGGWDAQARVVLGVYTFIDTSSHVQVRAWDPLTGATVNVYKGHSEPICVVACSEDGRVIGSGSGDCFIRMWRPDGSCAGAIETSSEVRALSFAPDGQSMLAGGFNGSAVVYALEGTVLQQLYLHAKPCHGIAFAGQHSNPSGAICHACRQHITFNPLSCLATVPLPQRPGRSPSPVLLTSTLKESSLNVSYNAEGRPYTCTWSRELSHINRLYPCVADQAGPGFGGDPPSRWSLRNYLENTAK